MIDASQRMIGKEKHNPIVNNHLELIIIIKRLKMHLGMQKSWRHF
jgi:hypothetical protein